ncbi:hypothetical protein ACOMHN_017677 [Nucella lapillus]
MPTSPICFPLRGRYTTSKVFVQGRLMQPAEVKIQEAPTGLDGRMQLTQSNPRKGYPNLAPLEHWAEITLRQHCADATRPPPSAPDAKAKKPLQSEGKRAKEQPRYSVKRGTEDSRGHNGSHQGT